MGNEGLSKAVEFLAGVKAKTPGISFAGVPDKRRLQCDTPFTCMNRH